MTLKYELQLLVNSQSAKTFHAHSALSKLSHSLLQNNPKPTENEVEDIFDGNICRCTGYRPILDAMKSFAVDHTPKSDKPVVDIEASPSTPRSYIQALLIYHIIMYCTVLILSLTLQDLAPCVYSDPDIICMDLAKGLKRTTFDPKWYCPSTLSELVAIARGNQEKRIRLVAGDTGKGQQSLCLYQNI